jgi:hypothetical protein
MSILPLVLSNSLPHVPKVGARDEVDVPFSTFCQHPFAVDGLAPAARMSALHFACLMAEADAVSTLLKWGAEVRLPAVRIRQLIRCVMFKRALRVQLHHPWEHPFVNRSCYDSLVYRLGH